MTIKIPPIKVSGFQTVEDYITALYQTLGWNPSRQTIDPRKIRIHPATWNKLAAILMKRYGRRAGFLWMNVGPSPRDDIKRYEIDIETGAFEDR